MQRSQRAAHRTPLCVRIKFACECIRPQLERGVRWADAAADPGCTVCAGSKSRVPVIDSSTPVSRVFFGYLGNNGYSCKKRTGALADGDAYANPEKFEFLTVALGMTMLRGIPQQNFEEVQVRNCWQEQLAEVLGVQRSTVTARISNFCDPYDWQLPAASIDQSGGASSSNGIGELSGNVAAPHRPAGRADQLPDSAAGEKTPGRRLRRRRGPAILTRCRRWCAPNYYGIRVRRDRHGKGATSFRPASLAMQVKDPEMGHIWDAGKLNVSGFAGWKDVPDWIWHPAFRVNEVTRVLLTAYCVLGMLDVEHSGYGVIEKFQAFVADYIGVSLPSVRAAHRELAELGLVRIAHQTHPVGERRRPQGWQPEGPVKVLWVPGLVLSQEEAILETERMLAVQARQVSDYARQRFAQAFALHQAVLRAYIGSNRRLMSFWRDLQSRLEAAGIERSLVTQICPLPGHPPG